MITGALLFSHAGLTRPSRRYVNIPWDAARSSAEGMLCGPRLRTSRHDHIEASHRILALRGTLFWLAAAAPAAIIIAAGVWRLGTGVLPVAFAAETRLSGLRGVSVGELLADESSALSDLYQEVSRVRADIEPATGLMRWLGRVSLAFSWLPVAHQEMAASAERMERVQKGLDAASVLLDSSSGLLDLYSDAQTAILTSGSGPSLPLLKDRVRSLETSFADSLDAIGDADQTGRAFSVGLQTPRGRDLTGLLGELEERMLTASRVGQQASSLLADLLRLADDAQPLMAQFVVNGSEPEAWTSETLEATLTGLNENTIAARRKAEELATLISDMGQAERLRAELATLDQVLSVLLTVSRASMAGLSAFEPGAKALGEAGGGLLSSGEGMLSIFDAFVERSDEIVEAIADLQEAQIVLGELAAKGDRRPFARGLADISNLVTDLRSGLLLVHSIAPMGREMLGAGGARNYLVLGHSADELRATGGFVSSIWVATFQDGGLANIHYEDSISVDDWDRIELYPKAPPGLEEHMYGWVWLLRDVSWEPNFPTTAVRAEDMYRIGKRQEVDGVIAINQWTLLRLIESLGEVPSPDGGKPLTPRNLLTILEEGTDQHGRAYMDVVLQGVLDRLNQPMSMPTLMRLASGLHETLQERDMLVFFDDPDLQSVMRDFSWDGGIAAESMDYLYVIDSNVGWSKVDRNIERAVRYQVDLSRGARPRVSLTLAYNNHSGPGSPGCEPQWLNRGNDYGQLKNACYWNLTRVYLPQGSRMLSSSPLPLPAYSVSAEIGYRSPGEDTGRVSSSHNKTVFSGLTTLEANLVYDLPESAVRREGDRLIYELLVQKQPGVRQRSVEVDLELPEGYRLTSSSTSPVYTGDSRVGFAFALTQDTLLRVELKKDGDGSGL